LLSAMIGTGLILLVILFAGLMARGRAGSRGLIRSRGLTK
jgi:hypothetical protein